MIIENNRKFKFSVISLKKIDILSHCATFEFIACVAGRNTGVEIIPRSKERTT